LFGVVFSSELVLKMLRKQWTIWTLFFWKAPESLWDIHIKIISGLILWKVDIRR